MPSIRIEVPDWIERIAEPGRRFASIEDRVGLAIALARENVARGAGGPFGAAVFESESGRLVAAGVNLVVPGRNSILHAEVVALMRAHARTGSYTLGGEMPGAGGLPAHDLAASCDPCAMCIGAVHWSGVRRLLAGASREDALAVGFDEGPVFPASFEYLEAHGVELVRGIRRDEARAVLERYVERGGTLYNA